MAAGFFDLVDNAMRRAGIGAGAFEACADVADDNARAFLRHQERNAAPDAAPGAGDNGDFAVNDAGHAHFPQTSSSDFDDHLELGPLLVLGQHVAFFGRGEAALRRQGELVEAGELCRLLEAALDRVLALERPVFVVTRPSTAMRSFAAA